MYASQKQHTLTYTVFFFILGVLLPLPTLALRLSEIMYNPEGADTRREWIEVFNDEGSPVDIGAWYLHEDDTFHGLHPDGFQLLPVGEYAIITTDPSRARGELGSSLRYVKASFSLKNTGERVDLADGTKTVRDSFSYSPTIGANGNGKSLQRIGSSWKEALPTPGKENVVSQEDPDQDSSSFEEVTEEENGEDSTIERSFRARFRILPSTSVEGEIVRFEHEVFYGKERVLEGIFILNFGDGVEIHEREWEERHSHVYRHAGSYLVTFRYYENVFDFQEERDPTISIQRTVTVLPGSKVGIQEANPYDGVILENASEERIHLSHWKLEWNGEVYTFPSASYLPPNGTVRVSYETLGFRPNFVERRKLILRSDSGYTIDFYPRRVSQSAGQRKGEKRTERRRKRSIRKVEEEREVLDRSEESYLFRDLPDHVNGKDHPFEDYMRRNPGKELVSFSEVQGVKGREENPWKFVSLGLSFLLVLVSVRAYLYRTRNGRESTPQNSQEDSGIFSNVQLLED